jgi:hypothetical protein
MIDHKLTAHFKNHLARRLVFCPDLANLATRQLWDCLSADIRDVVCMADCYIALIDVNRKTHRALVFDFVDFNLLSTAESLDKLTEILRITHALTGLTTVATVHQKRGVMAKIDDRGEYSLWRF